MAFSISFDPKLSQLIKVFPTVIASLPIFDNSSLLPVTKLIKTLLSKPENCPQGILRYS